MISIFVLCFVERLGYLMNGSMMYHFINGSAFQCIDFAGDFFIEKKDYACLSISIGKTIKDFFKWFFKGFCFFINSAYYCFLLCIARMVVSIFIIPVVLFFSVAF